MRAATSFLRRLPFAPAIASILLGLPASAQTPKSPLTCTAVTSAASNSANVWDNSGNSLLNGTHYFRYVQYTIGDQQGDLSRAIALYQNITFDGNGKYNLNAVLLDSKAGSSPQPKTLSGTYSISSCGFGFISNPLSPLDLIWGSVAQNGAFIGSTTETQAGFNDLFVSAPLNSPAPTEATLAGTYSVGYMNFRDGLVADTIAAGFQIVADGSGGIGGVNMQAYQGANAAVSVTESATYHFVNGAGVLTFSNNGTVIAGQEYLYISPDGNFIFGGAPNRFDLYFGVRTALLPSSAQPGQTAPSFDSANFGGLYYQIGLDDNLSNGAASLQTSYGSFKATAGIILDHQRILAPLRAPQLPLGYPSQAFGSTFQDSYSLAFSSSGGYVDAAAAKQYVIGANGLIRLGFGISPSLGISVALQAPSFNTPAPPAVSINPAGVLNAASYAPFTSGISPNEIVIIFGSNLAPQPSSSGSTPANVQVMMNGIAASILSTNPQEIIAVVPSTITGPYAQIQVINGGTASNVVWAIVEKTTPGVFTLAENGIGAALALDSNALITQFSPAHAGDTLSIFVTGLGALTPPSTLPGPFLPVNNITGTISGMPATISFSSISGTSGVNQINIVVPAGISGAAALVISGPDSQATQTTIFVSGAASSDALGFPLH